MQNGSCKLLTTGQAAQRLGLSLSTLSKWRLTGEGPTFLKLGASVSQGGGVIANSIKSSE
jgi:hypothetical protein